MSRSHAKRRKLQKRRRPAEKNVMEEFQIDFLSPVDRPAQAPAQAVLMKRQGDAKPGDIVWKGDTPGIMTSEDEGHAHIVWLWGTAGETTMQRLEGEEGHHDHPWTLEPDGSVRIGANAGHSHTIDPTRVTAALVEMQKRLSEEDEPEETDPPEAKKGSGEYDDATSGDSGRRRRRRGARKGEDDMPADEKTLKALEAKIEKADERNALLGLLVGMTDVEKAHFDGLDDAAKPEFATSTHDERAALIEKVEKARNADDPVIYTCTDGTQIRKSHGDMVALLAKRADAADARADAAQKVAKVADLRKRAEDTMGNLPGTLEEHVSHLEAIDSIEDEDAREAALKAIRVSNSNLAKGFQRVGSASGGQDLEQGGAMAKLDDMAEQIAKRDNISKPEAMQKALATPEGEALYEEQRNERFLQ